jgi:hypothetical protein
MLASYESALWTCLRIAGVIAEQFGVVHYSDHIGRLLCALCVSPDHSAVRLSFRLHPNANINAKRVVHFLEQLLAQVDTRMVLLWGRPNAPRALLVQDFLAAHREVASEFVRTVLASPSSQ